MIGLETELLQIGYAIVDTADSSPCHLIQSKLIEDFISDNLFKMKTRNVS